MYSKRKGDIWEGKSSQSNFEKEQTWRKHTTWFKIYYKATVIKNVVAKEQIVNGKE